MSDILPTVVTYRCGARITQMEQGSLVINDLLDARNSSLAARVGLGRLLTLPYLLGEAINLHVPNPADLMARTDRQLVATILAATGSTLSLGDSVYPFTSDSSPQEVVQVLAPVAVTKNSFLATDDDTDVYGSTLAVPNLAHALIRGLELSGPRAAAMLNAVPRWRTQSKGQNGYTRHSIADSANRADPKRLTRRLADSVQLSTSDLSSWDQLISAIAGFGQIVHLDVTVPTDTQHVLTHDQYLVLATVIDYMTGSLTGPSVPSVTPLDLQLADYTRFVLDVITGAFLASNRIHPPSDQQRAATFAARLRAERPDISDHRLADRLNESGFHTKSGVGVWHAGTAKALLETVTLTNAGGF